MPRQHFTKEFKQQVVRYVLDNKPTDRGGKIAFMRETGEHFGVDLTTIYGWMPGHKRKRRSRVNRGEVAGRKRAAEKRVTIMTDQFSFETEATAMTKLREENLLLKKVIAKLLKESA